MTLFNVFLGALFAVMLWGGPPIDAG